ncbi:glycosyltransferase [Lacisediminihabitans sp.]|jgi:UDP:flavonoid glycosyltransferase YjiC (YdhE family)|uniref:glycosyltransferase n=1 Tax=Lacisediminihabitans sp. TaxID=2787631 RepID=UPI002F9501A0
MSSFLFVTVDAGGNVPPVVAIGRELLARGHRVRILGHEPQRAALEAAGFEFTAYSRMPRWEPTRAKSVPRAIADLLRLSTHSGLGQDLIDLVTESPADLVVVDCMLLSVLKAANASGLRHAVLFHTFYRFWTREWMAGPVGGLARLKGLNARSLWAKADLELVVCDRTLDPAGESASPTRVWSGVVETGARRVAGAAVLPLVLVSLSTTWFPGQDDAYRHILAALADLPVRAIVTTGPAVNPRELSAPANAEVLAFAPHDALLPTVTAVIGHGGHSTTMAALAHDLPLIIMPMHPLIDQPMIARAVVDAGAGIRLSRTASPGDIRRAVTTLLATESFAEAAAVIGARLRAADGARVAADLILRAVVAPGRAVGAVPVEHD